MAQQPSPITWLLMRWEVPVRRIREETEDLFSEIFKIYGYSGMEEWTLNLVPPRVSRSPYLGLYLNYEGTEPTFTTFQLVILNGSMGNCIVQSFKDASFQFKNSRIGSAKFAIAEDVFDPKNGFVRECDGIIGILLRMRTIREGFEEMLEEGARRGAQWEVIPNYAPAIEDDSDDEDDEEDSSDDEDDEVTISDDGNDGPGITQTQTVETEVTISDDGNDGPGITQTQTVETVVEISDDEDETPMAASIRRAREQVMGRSTAGYRSAAPQGSIGGTTRGAATAPMGSGISSSLLRQPQSYSRSQPQAAATLQQRPPEMQQSSISSRQKIPQQCGPSTRQSIPQYNPPQPCIPVIRQSIPQPTHMPLKSCLKATSQYIPQTTCKPTQPSIPVARQSIPQPTCKTSQLSTPVARQSIPQPTHMPLKSCLKATSKYIPQTTCKPTQPSIPVARQSIPQPTCKTSQLYTPVARQSIPQPTFKTSQLSTPVARQSIPQPTFKTSQLSTPVARQSIPQPTHMPLKSCLKATSQNIPQPTRNPLQQSIPARQNISQSTSRTPAYTMMSDTPLIPELAGSSVRSCNESMQRASILDEPLMPSRQLRGLPAPLQPQTIPNRPSYFDSSILIPSKAGPCSNITRH